MERGDALKEEKVRVYGAPVWRWVWFAIEEGTVAVWGRGAVGCALWGVGSNVPDLIGRDFQGKPDGSPLVQGSVNRSRDQDGRAHDDASISIHNVLLVMRRRGG